MHRIDHSTNNATLPSPDAAGTAGYFKKGDPGTGVPATVVTADWANAMQEELAYVITQAGITLSKTNNTQLRAAIQAMIQSANSAIVISGATFEASVANGEAVRWDAGNNRFDEAIADGTSNNQAVGFADVTNSKVYCYGETPALFSGLTPGARYYLDSTTAGAITATAPADKVVVGVAKSATTLFADIDRLPAQQVPTGNAIINGCCRVAQRAAPNLSNTYQYGQVDRFAAKADGTVGAGTISQTTSSVAGRTGYALRLAGVTLTGAGAVYHRYRMESLDARQFKNQTIIVHQKVYHDVGSAKDYTITVNKANAANDFSAVTQIGASAAQSIASGAEGTISFVVALGDCSNGIEVIVKCDCGAVTTKNFDFTELQFEIGSVATDFERRDYQAEETKCMRYFEALADGNGNNRIWSLTETVGNNNCNWFFKVRKRAIPTLSGTYTGSIDTASPDHISLNIGAGTTSTFAGDCAVDAEL